MSQTMNQKAATKKKKFSKQEPVQEPEELKGVDKFLEDIKPHFTTIGLVAVAAFLGFLLIAFMMQNSYQANAAQWRDLNTSTAVALRTSDLKGWQKVAADYPDSKAAHWALQMTGDRQLGTGLEQFAGDREGALSLIGMAKKSFQQIVDAPDASKTTMIQRRSTFSLAYACESLGEFDEAKKYYKQLVDQAPDSAFADSARRGLRRCSDEGYAMLYNKIENWEEEEVGEAPGPAIPDRPVLDFPEKDIPAGVKPSDKPKSETIKNDFVPSTPATTDPTEPATIESPATTEPATTAPTTTQPPVTESTTTVPKTTEPMTETPATTEPASDKPPMEKKKDN